MYYISDNDISKTSYLNQSILPKRCIPFRCVHISWLHFLLFHHQKSQLFYTLARSPQHSSLSLRERHREREKQRCILLNEKNSAMPMQHDGIMHLTLQKLGTHHFQTAREKTKRKGEQCRVMYVLGLTWSGTRILNHIRAFVREYGHWARVCSPFHDP